MSRCFKFNPKGHAIEPHMFPSLHEQRHGAQKKIETWISTSTHEGAQSNYYTYLIISRLFMIILASIYIHLHVISCYSTKYISHTILLNKYLGSLSLFSFPEDFPMGFFGFASASSITSSGVPMAPSRSRARLSRSLGRGGHSHRRRGRGVGIEPW